MFFTLGNLCTRYHVQPITIRRWFARGAFPTPIQINGGRLLWPVAVVEEFERSFQKQTAADPQAKKEFA